MEFGVWDVAWCQLLGKEGEEAGWGQGRNLTAMSPQQAAAGRAGGSGEKADCHGDPGGADTAGPSPSPAPSSGWTTAVAAGEEAS